MNKRLKERKKIKETRDINIMQLEKEYRKKKERKKEKDILIL